MMQVATQPIQTPRAIVRRSAMIYAGGQLLFTVGMLIAWNSGDIKLARMLGYLTAFWGPWLLIVTYKQAVTAWRELPPDEVRDISVPTLWMVVAGAILYVLFY